MPSMHAFLTLITTVLLSLTHSLEAASSPRAFSEPSFSRGGHEPPSEAELRKWAVKLYHEQPLEPATSMDDDFKHQMTGVGELPNSDSPNTGGISGAHSASHSKGASGMAPPPALSFLSVWSVLDMAAQGIISLA